MGCTPIKNTPPTRDEFALWQSMGYTGDYLDYKAAKERIGEFRGYLARRAKRKRLRAKRS